MVLFIIWGVEILTALSIIICSWSGTLIHPALALPLIPFYTATYSANRFTRDTVEARALGFVFRIMVIEMVLWGWRADPIWLFVWLLGECLNLMALAANDMHMPMACRTTSWQHKTIDEHTRLRWLTDIFPSYLPGRKKVACYFSIGDILEILGLVITSTLLWVSWFRPA